MLPRRQPAIVTVITIWAFISCQPDPGFHAVNSDLAGTWEWISTDGGIGNNIHETPTSTGVRLVWRFTPDNKYEIDVNGVLQSEGTYLLVKKNCIHSGQQKYLIDFSSPADSDRMIELMERENMELSDESYDGIGIRFIRKSRTFDQGH
jgi:hypothetical protein